MLWNLDRVIKLHTIFSPKPNDLIIYRFACTSIIQRSFTIIHIQIRNTRISRSIAYWYSKNPKLAFLFECLIKIFRHFSKTKTLAIPFSKLLYTPNNRSHKVTDIAIYVALAWNLWTWFITWRIIENGIFVYQFYEKCIEMFNPRDPS